MPKIYNIRGTSGTGKSTVVRTIVEQYDQKTRLLITGRKQPIGYVLKNKGCERSLFVLGHYETPCGGCDTISSTDVIFEKAEEAFSAGHDVIFEGLIIGGEHIRSTRIVEKGIPLEFISLQYPIEKCLDAVAKRRMDKYEKRYQKVLDDGGSVFPDPPKSLNPKNTIAKVNHIKRAMQIMREKGATVNEFTREETVVYLKQELGLT